jgi:hypothetical protein
LIELILIKNEKQIINIGYSMAQSSPYDFDIYACLSGYQPRNPKASAYYTCVENHFEGLEQVWDDVYKSRYGYWRTYVMTVIYNLKVTKWVFQHTQTAADLFSL